jgi:hypothetical protein
MIIFSFPQTNVYSPAGLVPPSYIVLLILSQVNRLYIDFLHSKFRFLTKG